MHIMFILGLGKLIKYDCLVYTDITIVNLLYQFKDEYKCMNENCSYEGI
jgi:hypothetical protein